jgi:sarcosine oxidase subunit alpha
VNMAEEVRIRVNGRPLAVPQGTIVAAAIVRAGVVRFRRSLTANGRGPLCGMGICMECRVTINDEKLSRSCQTICAEGMEVQTDG